MTNDILINRQILFYDKLKLQSGESYSEHDDDDDEDDNNNDDDDEDVSNKFLNLNLSDHNTQHAELNSNNNTSLSDDVESDFSSSSHSPPHSSSSSCCSSLSSTEESDESPSFNSNSNTTTNNNNNNNNESSNNYSTIFSLKEHPLYRIQEKIRSGGYGDVYKGIRKTDNMPIAIKVIEKKKVVSWTTNEVSDSSNFMNVPLKVESIY
jgi:hypothetical protein